MAKLYERLKEIRIARGFTQDEVALKLHCTRSNVANYERGFASPDAEKLGILATLFNVSIEYLIGNTDDEKSVLSKQDKELFAFFNGADNLTEAQKESIKNMIDAYKAYNQNNNNNNKEDK